jgi:integrase
MASVFKRGGKGNRNGPWYISYWEQDGATLKRRTKCARTTDKAAALRIANKHETDAALRREGVIDPMLDAIGKESRRTIEEHLVDYENKLNAGGRSAQYVKETKEYIRKIAKSANFSVAADIEPDEVNRFANDLKELNKSARTIQAHLTAITGFTRWLSKNHKLPRDPLTSISKPNPNADRRKERRILLPEEWRKLAETTENGPVRFGMSGQQRLLLYQTAIETGLRSNELRGLTRTALVLNDATPFIRAKAGTTKNRMDAQQFIQKDFAEKLRAHVSKKRPTAVIFSLPDTSDMATMLRDDLAAARTAWLNEAHEDVEECARQQQSDFLTEMNDDGEVLDFHSLRHTCGAWLAMSGAHPKVVQQVMRHSSITLTMDTYGHLFPGQESEAVARLERYFGPESNSLAVSEAVNAVPETRSAGRSSGGTAACLHDTRPYEKEGKPDPQLARQNNGNSASRYEPVLSATMAYDPFASLAQLAEQLTLNQ